MEHKFYFGSKSIAGYVIECQDDILPIKNKKRIGNLFYHIFSHKTLIFRGDLHITSAIKIGGILAICAFLLKKNQPGKQPD